MIAVLSPLEFNTILRLSQAADLIRLHAKLDLDRAVAARNAYYATIAQTYGLPPAAGAITYNDETLEIDVTPAAPPKGTP